MMTEREQMLHNMLARASGYMNHFEWCAKNGLPIQPAPIFVLASEIRQTLEDARAHLMGWAHTAHELAALQEQGMQLTDQEMKAISAARGMT